MSLISDQRSLFDGPELHALVIGVNSYKFLDGAESRVGEPKHGLGQLTSPVPSAKAMAACILGLRNPIFSRVTIDLLLSSAGSGQTFRWGERDLPVLPGTGENIETAFREWFAHCNADRSNVAIFYFCGHGVGCGHDPTTGETVILASDFDPQKPSRGGAYSIESTGDEMRGCKAHAQCLFVDACRHPVGDVVPFRNFRGVPLLGVTEPLSIPQSSFCLLNSTRFGYRSFGNRGEVSRFTAALLTAMQGGAASRTGKRLWRIDPSGLYNAVRRLALRQMRLGEVPLNEMQKPTISELRDGGDETALHLDETDPEVWVDIACDPTEAIRHAAIRLQRIDKPFLQEVSKHNRDEWNLRAPSGCYGISAAFDTGRFHNRDYSYVHITPPTFALDGPFELVVGDDV